MARPFRRAVAALAVCVASAAVAAPDADTARWRAWHEKRALWLRAHGLLQEASEEWAALAELSPGDPDAAIRAAVEILEAVSRNDRLLQKMDPAYRAVEHQCRLAAARGGLHDGALAYAIGRLRLADRDWSTAYAMLGIAADHGFDPIRARHWYFLAAVNHAQGLIDRGRVDEVVRTLEELIRDLPAHPYRLAADVNLASAYRYREEHGLAEGVLRDAIRRHPDAAKTWDVLGQVFADQQRLDEAAEAYGRAIDLAAARDDARYTGPTVLGEALAHAVQIDIRRERLDDARRHAQRLLQVRGDDPEGFALLGQIALARGGDEDIREAVVLLRRAVRLAPEEKNHLARLAEALHLAGEDAESREVRDRLDAIRKAETADEAPGTMEPQRNR